MQQGSQMLVAVVMIPHTAKVMMFNDSVLQTESHEDTLIPTEQVLLLLVDFPTLFQD